MAGILYPEPSGIASGLGCLMRKESSVEQREKRKSGLLKLADLGMTNHMTEKYCHIPWHYQTLIQSSFIYVQVLVFCMPYKEQKELCNVYDNVK
jgi:hypothetical protein